MCKYSLIFVIVVLFNRQSLLATGAEDKTSEVSAEKRKEIESLRAELNKAFDAHDDQQLQAHQGIIVQPKWLQDKVEKPTPTNAKVVVTKQGLDEVKALRDEIQRAVAKDTYVASIAGATKDVQELHEELHAKQQGKSQLDTLLTSPEDRAEEDMLGSLQDDDLDFKAAGPNIVDANVMIEPNIDLRKLQRIEISKRRTKEVLLLKSIEEDFSFDLGADVVEWEHIIHAGQEFFIGRRNVDLLIVRKNAAKYESNMILEIGQPITYLETYSYWNTAQQQQEGIIIVGTADKVLWYRANHETLKLELYWEWTIGLRISGLNHFNIDTKNYLAITTNVFSPGNSSLVNIYQFKLDSREFWIAQHLPMTSACLAVAFLDTGRDLILAVAQNHTAVIYSFNPNVPVFHHLYFQHLRSIASEDIESIAAFKMGGLSYLALGGRNPQILMYQQGDFVSKTILAQNFGLVELFFPIPIRTYRDDLLLLVQHRVDFSTHTLTVLETLIWNGDAFETTIPAPCQLGQHVVYGVSCMLDVQRDQGLKGAALLRRGDEVSIIVPRHNAESGLFRLHTELLAKNSELLDLQEIFAFLKDWVKEQDDLIAQAQAFLKMPDFVAPETIKHDFSHLETLKTPQINFAGQYGELYVNDYLWTEQDSNTDLEFVIEAIQQLEAELRRTREKRAISKDELVFDSLDFDVVEVGELNIKKLNDEEFYIQNGQLDFDGLLTVNDLEVSDSGAESIERQAVAETLAFAQDIVFEKINGIDWQDLMENIVMRNQPLELDELNVAGQVIVEDELNIEHLNMLKFPHAFLWSSGPTSSIVSAEKEFTGTLSANAVDTDGLINGMNPTDAVTLAEAQHWPGFPTFTQLEITETFNLTGTAQGRGLRNFPKNPTLEEAEIIQAACLFEELEVNGPIIVQGQLDKGSLDMLLDSVIERPEEPMEELLIEAPKTFAQLELPIDFNVMDAQVNNISIADFIPKHTEQDLLLTALHGYVYFNNLSLTGNYDDVNLQQLLQDAIKINEPQTSPQTQLNFLHDVQAKQVAIKHSINGAPIQQELVTLDSNLQLKNAKFQHLSAHTANMPNDITGNASLNDINLQEMLNDQTSLQNEANLFLNELVVEGELETDELHGIDAQVLLNFLEDDDLPEKILDGIVQVDHVIISGDVQVNKLNDQHFDEHVQLTAIWLNRPNYLSTELKFLEPLRLQSDLNVLGDFNSENLLELIDDLVFRTDTKAEIFAPKSFMRDVKVRVQTQMEAINGIPFTAIANKQHNLTLLGSLHINSNLSVRELHVANNLNDYYVHNVSKLLRYLPSQGSFVILGDHKLPHQQHLQDLTVLGDMHQLPNMHQFFANILYKQQPCALKGKTTFTGRVNIDRGAYIRSLNGYNLLALLNHMVFKHEPERVFIKSPITFGSTVHARFMSVQNTLRARNLNGCVIEEWLNDTLHIDRALNITTPLQFAPLSLDNNALHAETLNDVNLKELLTLHTPQNLTGDDIAFSQLILEGTVATKGLINGVNLSEAYENTLLRYGNQHIITPLSMPSAEVLNALEIKALVNGDKNLSDVATLHEPTLTLESPLYFQNLTVRHLQTEAELSGINMNEWYEKSLWLNSRAEQHITGNWSVNKLLVKDQPIMPTSTYDTEYDLERYSRATKLLCYRIKKIEEKLQQKQQQQEKRIKSLKQRFVLQIRAPSNAESYIRKAFVLTYGNERVYLVINLGCNSQLYQWHNTNQSFGFISEFVSGPIDEVFTMPLEHADAELKFVTSFESGEYIECAFDYLNTWPQLDIAQARSLNAPNIYRLFTLNGSNLLQQQLAEEQTQQFLAHKPALLSKEKVREKRLTMYKYSLPLFYKRSSKQLLKRLNKNIARANATGYSFEDFRTVVANILNDLNYRLNLEINITQLSIPESDLFDAHLMQDYIAIMEELQQQQFFNAATFGNLSTASLKLPSTPAQVLAAHSVQLIWPVIVEIEAIHANLQANHTHQHPLCLHLSNALAETVRDVLILANESGTNGTDENAALSAVIQRIRALQSELIAMQLGELTVRDYTNYTSPYNTTQMEVFLALANTKEAIKLQVGPNENLHALLAVTIRNDSTATDAIHIFHDIENGTLLQSLKITQPHGLTAARLHNESLLACIEQQHTLHVFVYRGIQGFIPWAKQKLTSVGKSLMQVSLPQAKGNDGVKHYIVAVHAKKLVFYEILMSNDMPLSRPSVVCQ